MKLLDIVTSPWAIQPDKLVEIQNIYATHLRGEKIDIAGVEARLGKPLVNEPKPYQVIDGVALIAIDGVLAKRANMFMQISGGTSMQLVERDLQAALQDEQVHSIVLMIDSPGGTVDGTQVLGDAILAARQTKPVVALASGMMASAAYWIGSAAQAVYIADSTTQVGSIGVVTKHVDVSGSEASAGVKTTEIYSGKYKRIASGYSPLSEEGRAHMQAQTDYLYSLFVAAVAKQRGVSEEKVLSDMADGRVFIGQQAIDAGLVDGVSTLPGLITQLNEARTAGDGRTTRAGVAQTTPPNSQKDPQMDLTTLKAQHPDLYQAVVTEGASAERARIQAVLATAIPGHEALVNKLAFDGTTTPGEAAQAVLAAERNVRATQQRALSADAPAPVVIAATPAVQPTAAEQQAAADANLPLEERARKQWDANPTLRAEFGDSFSSYLAYTKAESAGQVKVLSRSK